MKVVNLYNHPVQVKLNTSSGVQYAHIAAKGNVDLPEDYSVDNNYMVMHPKVIIRGQASIKEDSHPVAAFSAPIKAELKTVIKTGDAK